MLPLLPFHALASQRGDGLRPALLALFLRDARQHTALSAGIDPDDINVASDQPFADNDAAHEKAMNSR